MPKTHILPKPGLTIFLAGLCLLLFSVTLAKAQVSSPGLNGVQSIASGGNASCTILAGGSVHCWGSAHWGQDHPPAGLAAKQIAVGYYNACAIRTDGRPLCWGDNRYGQSQPPTGLGGLAEIRAGAYQTCALDRRGQISCWGLGGGPGSLRASSISMGMFHACALAYGWPVCWKDGWGGATQIPEAWPQASVLTAGLGKTCLAAGEQKNLLCTGYDLRGANRPPASLSGVQDIALGNAHGCALTDRVICWGWNGSGAAQPPALTGIKQLSAGAGFSCALGQDGRVSCWGQNDLSQLDGQSLAHAATNPGLSPARPFLEVGLVCQGGKPIRQVACAPGPAKNFYWDLTQKIAGPGPAGIRVLSPPSGSGISVSLLRQTRVSMGQKSVFRIGLRVRLTKAVRSPSFPLMLTW